MADTSIGDDVSAPVTRAIVPTASMFDDQDTVYELDPSWVRQNISTSLVNNELAIDAIEVQPVAVSVLDADVAKAITSRSPVAALVGALIAHDVRPLVFDWMLPVPVPIAGDAIS